MSEREPYFVLNVNPDGTDVLHRNPRESCNTQADEMPGREVIDAETADALLTMDSARRCGHCFEEPS